MKFPKVSAACITCGRVERLEEAIQCFLNQDYSGEKELVIYNDYPRQELIFDHPLIHIINSTEKVTVGEARNRCNKNCLGDIIMHWDDDDLILPHHMTDMQSNLKYDWVRQTVAYAADNYKIVHAKLGATPQFAYTKKIWESCGGFMDMNAGEDIEFINKVKKQGKGHSYKPVKISYIYSWGNNVYHASGLGRDSDKEEPLHVRIIKDLDRRVDLNEIPIGKIYLTPQLIHDPKVMVQDFFERSNINS